MSKQSKPRKPIECSHISTSGVEVLGVRQLWAVPPMPGMAHRLVSYGITNCFLVNGVQWRIRAICSVPDPEVRTQKYNEENHRNLNHLILIQAHDLFNRLIGSRYNEIELGVKYVGGQRAWMRDYGITVRRPEHDPTCRASCGYFHHANCQIDLSYAQNAQYFNIGEKYKPYFKLTYRAF